MDPSREASRRRFPRWLPQVAGYCLSAVCLIYVLHGYPIKSDLLPAIRDLDWKWVVLSVVLDLVVYVCHGWRWKTLLNPVVRVGLWRTVQAIYIGIFANEVLPLRVGELIRCYLLAHWNDLRISLGFASAAVERLIDGFWLLAAFFITAAFVKGIPRDLVILVQIMGALLILGAILLFWIVFHKQEAHAVISESRWSSTLRHIIEGLHLMGNRRTLGLTALISLLYLLLQMFSVYALMKAYALDLSFWVACGVLTIIRFVTVVPNAPGNIGLVNVACITALKLFDVETRDAKTFSIILLAALTGPLLIGGAIATALTGVNIGEIHHRARQRIIAPDVPEEEG
jgi:glycosyltransferase 2 family protein